MSYPEPPRSEWAELALLSEAEDPRDYEDIFDEVLDQENFEALEDRIIVPFGSYSDFPDEAPFDGAKAEALDSNVVFRWDESAGDWIALNTGTSDDPVPGTTHLESASIESLDNVFHASAFDGADGGEQIQAAVDAAEATNGYNAVITGPVGPQNGVWETDSAIELGDNTLFILRGEIKRTAPCNLLKNRDTANGNSNITVIGQGGLLNFNAQNVARQETLDDLGVRFVRVDGIEYRGVHHKDNHSWNTKFEGCSEVGIRDIWFNQTQDFSNGDGIDINLPANDVTIDGVHGLCSDDIVAINGVNGSDYKWLEIDGPHTSQNITISNVTADVTGNYAALKILTVAGNELSDVTATNISSPGNSNFIPIRLGDGAVGHESPSADEVHDMTFQNVTCKDCQFAFDIREPVSEVSIDGNFRFRDDGFDIHDGVTVDGLTVNGTYTAHPDASGGPTWAPIPSNASVDLRVTDLHVKDASVVFGFSGDSTSGTINNVTVEGTPQSDIYSNLSNVEFGPNVPPIDSGSFTHTGGGSTTAEESFVWKEYDRATELVWKYDSTTFDAEATTFGATLDSVEKQYDTSDSWQRYVMTFGWGTDPGSGNDVTIAYEIRPR